MAINPTVTNGIEKKKRKPQGPRIVKPKTLYIAMKNDGSDFQVFDDAEQVLSLHETDPGAWKVKRHVLPMKGRTASAPTPAAPSA